MFTTSEPLNYDAEETVVSAAINALPIFSSDESITVVQQPSSTPTFEFTFVSKRGKYKLFSLNYTITQFICHFVVLVITFLTHQWFFLKSLRISKCYPFFRHFE